MDIDRITSWYVSCEYNYNSYFVEILENNVKSWVYIDTLIKKNHVAEISALTQHNL